MASNASNTRNATKASKASVALIARKGGVGKTTLAGSLAVALNKLGRRVVALDTDPQGSLSAWAQLGSKPAALRSLVRRLEVTDAGQLHAAIAGLEADRVLIDTPPGFDRAALAVALVADVVLLPCGPSPLDLLATRDVLGIIEDARSRRRDKGPLVAFVPSRVTRSSLAHDLIAGLEAFGHPVLPPIWLRTAFARSAIEGRTVAEAEPRSAAAADILALAVAVERLIEKGNV